MTRHKRRNLSVGIKRHICAAFAGFDFLFVLGVARRIECGTLGLGKGTAFFFAGIAVFAAAAYKGGFLGGR